LEKLVNQKIYIGNLPYSSDEQSLRETFEQFGEVVEVRLMIDRETGRSRGFGFITYADEAGAKKALTMDGQSLDGRKLIVNFAREQQRTGGGAGGGGAGGNRGGSRGGEGRGGY
jgi:RNA recognition motif-containing protein